LVLTCNGVYRCLDKAAIPIGNTHPAGVDFESLTEKRNPWRLCTVTQVEEVKLIIRILPIWLTTIVYGLVISQSLTFFVEQASTLDRAVDSLFTIPSASLLAFSSVAILIMLPIYECCIAPLCRWLTRDGSGITLLQRLGIGLLLSVFSMIIAALVERKRLTVAADYGLLDDSSTTIPMSVFWLVPQYMLFGISDVFALVGQQEFFYDQVPDNMRSIGMALYLCGYGAGSYLSSALVSLVEAVTSAGGNSSWIVDNLNRCRLDYFYYLLAALSFVNFGVFVLLALSYSYKGSHVRSL
jgi:peptide/histidine transporter 3/4